MPGIQPMFQPLVGRSLKSALWLLSRTRLPQVRGRLRLKGLNGPVEVLRDRWYVPHIYASSTGDAVFAQGFVHAQERLWQMDIMRRAITGRLAEVVGEVALPADRAMRTVGLHRTAEREISGLPEDLIALMQSYCAGANAWIELAVARRKLPVEFTLLGYQPESWRLADINGWAKLMSWTLAGNWESEFLRGALVRRLGAEKVAALELNTEKTWAVVLDAGKAMTGRQNLDSTRPYTGAHAGEGAGSNNWVLHGSRTASGQPLLANDMHLELTTPAIWFENHLEGGDLKISGISLPGTPLITAGHNQHVAWGFTDGFADVQDLYEEHLRPTPDGGWEYEFQGAWLPAEVLHEQIRVKGGKVVDQDIVITRHGPVINALFEHLFPDAPPLALRWTALDPETTIQGLYGMNMARNCAEFREALRWFSGPVQNTVYADTQGNIAYSLPGRVPIRARGDGSLPSPGWTGEYEWTDAIPFDDLPHLLNPARGYVASANNPVVDARFPYFISRDYCTADRAARIVELIEANPRIDIAYVQKMHTDQISLSARAMGRVLGQLQVSEPDLQKIVQGMRGWSGDLNAQSWQAAVFEVATRQAIRLVLEHQLGDLAVRAQGGGPFSGLWGFHTWEWFIDLLDRPASPWFDLGGGEQRDDVLRLALRQAVDMLKEKFGARMHDWHWGKLHHLTFRHLLGRQTPLDAILNSPTFPIGGDGSTIWASFTSFYDLARDSVVGPPFRFIADLGDLDHCLGVLAPGQSGNLASPHYLDGLRPWLEGKYHPMLFRRDEVEQNLAARMRFDPV